MSPRQPLLGFMALLLLTCVVPWGLSRDKKTVDEKKKPAKATVLPSDPALYVGADTCKTCHEDLYNHFETTAHFATTLEGKVGGRKGPEWHGCEACHGPGKEHVDGGGDRSKIFTFKDSTPQEASGRCLRCHQYTEEHGNYDRSMHLANGVGCTDCHSPHQASESQYLMKAKSPDLCYSCHASVSSEFELPFHHRVNEGLVQCNDCHSPHGTFRPKQLRTDAAGDEVCFKCHTEKKGPFVYQHEAKIEGCVVCHSPHGSVTERLLVQNQVNLICLSCHALPADIGPPGTPTFHNQAQKYQSCTMCHTAIHGSNTSHVFFTP